ncbi:MULTISPECIES: phage major capsid protein [unclassified Mycobacterium]|uniref:phage major capsid protein n=1 Tax=unclassified Mycobacterium TaxID=2642494 RepID=UPI000A74CB4A|nr:MULTISPECIES: phage major capsid protein [unclassified Mycobacterium]
MPAVSVARLRDLEARKQAIARAAEVWLLELRANGQTEMSPEDQRRYDAYTADLRMMSEQIDEVRSDLDRGRLPDRFRGGGHRAVGTAGALAPLGYSDEQLRRAFDQLHRGETAVLEVRTTNTVGGLVPPELGPILPVFPRHENRLLDRLPGVQIDVPAIAYVEVVSTSGNAAIVPEGGAKPELVMPAIPQTATARKIAAHTGISWEAYSGDYPAFVAAVQTELLKKVVDEENAQLYGGTGEANGQVNGIATNATVLTLDASTISTQPGPWDAIEEGIELLRSGPALAEANLALCNPATWSAIRRVTDNYGRYYVAPDPSSAEVNTAWGVDVVVSTQFTAGQFVLLDTRQYGRAVIRESLVTRIGYAGSDFTDNVVRFVSEERLTQAIERPQAICVISGLPTTATRRPTTKTGK